MDMNLFTLENVARQRLDELRAQGQRSSVVSATRRPFRPLRVRLGQALIRLGHRLAPPLGAGELTRCVIRP